jgi:hypothetical protein
LPVYGIVVIAAQEIVDDACEIWSGKIGWHLYSLSAVKLMARVTPRGAPSRIAHVSQVGELFASQEDAVDGAQ